MSQLRITQFGSKILRDTARQLTSKEISSAKTQQIIKDMKTMLVSKKLGIGLAAPQIGNGIALAVIAIRPSETRPKAKPFDLVIINPKITDYIGKEKALWEGCISSGSNGQADLFAKVPRSKDIKVRYYDEQGKQHHKTFKGLQAQVIQHEADHLNGILFIDRVKDTKTYMTYNEYLKMVKAEQ